MWTECDVVIAVRVVERRRAVPMRMRGRTMVMARMVVCRVLVHVQRRHDTRCGYDSRDE